tara:strand:+ start:319 stop:558 length:240 start_codon:yes stop_codon:yes gene_type:complete
MKILLKITLNFLFWFRGLFHYGTIPYFNCYEHYKKNGCRIKKNKKLIKIAQAICWKTEQLYRFLDDYYYEKYDGSYYYD